MNKLPGAYVGLYHPSHQGLLHFYCPGYSAYGKLKEGNPYGRDLHCCECSTNHFDTICLEYVTVWHCRRIPRMYPPLPSKKQIKDMFDFIAGPFSNSKRSNDVSLKSSSKIRVSSLSPAL